ncbi:unnamed protein product [Gadus morhua 'NCC']
MKAAVPFLFFVSGCCMTWTEALTVNGSVGGTVRIKCTHVNARSNTKYFCKGECRQQDVLITSETRGSEKYSIEDKGNAFITTIRNLQLKDTGTYWCGIGRIGPDTYVEVHLKVDDDLKSDVHAVQETTTTEFEPTGRQTDFENDSSKGRSISGDLSYQLIYKGPALGVAVLVLALVLLKFCRIKRRSAAFVSDRNQSTNECPGEPRRNSLLPASLTNSHPDSAIYSNVNERLKRFTMTVMDPKDEDSGTYLCLSDR